MGISKLHAGILTVSLIALMVIVVDILSIRKGRDGFIASHVKSGLSEHIETKNDVDRKLNEISNSIISLSSRLSNIELSISKLDKSFEKKVIYPLRPKSTEADSSNTKENIFEHVHHKHNNRIQRHRYNPSSMKNSKPPRKYNDVTIPNLYNSQSESVISSPNRSYHAYNDDIGFTNIETESPVSRSSHSESSIPRTARNINMNGMNGNGVNIHKKESGDEMNPTPIISRAIIKKIRVSFEPINKPHKDLLSGSKSMYPLNMSEIFPDLTREDPIVEVKKFNDLDSFRNFGNSLMNHKPQENDGAAETNYYKMSDILNPTKDANSNKTVDSAKESKPSSQNIIPEFDKIGEVKESIDLFENMPKSMAKIGLSDSSVPSGSAAKNEISKNAVENDVRVLESKHQTRELPADVLKSESFCEEFEDPSKAFKEGKCIFKKQPQSSNSETLVNEERDSATKSKLPNEIFGQLEATIKDLEEKLKESKKIEDKLIDKKAEISKPVEFDHIKQDELHNLNENTMKEIEELQKEFKDTENDFFKSAHFKTESDDLIQKPTKIQPVTQ